MQLADNVKPQWTIPGAGQTTEDPLLECLVILTEHYGSPCSGEALVASLPMREARLTPELFPQASSRAGLVSRVVRKPLNTIGEMLTPCVLLLVDQKACLLRSFDKETGTAVIQLPDTGGETELTQEELEAIYIGYAILVKKQYRGDQSVDVHLHTKKGHWLFSMLKEAAPIYREALLASVVVNLFALVSPLFMMNVYDKILPNQAFESLWVLASGAALAFTFDYILRYVRSMLIDNAGKKIDIVVSSRIFAKSIGIPLEKRGPSVGGMAKQISEFDSVREMLTSTTITTLVDLPFAIFFLFIIYIFAGDLAFVPLVSGLIIIGYACAIQPKLRAAIEESNKFAGLKNGHLIESLSAMESIKANLAEGIVQKTWQQMIAHSATWGLKVKKTSQSVSYLATFVTQMTAIAVVILGVFRVSQGDISMGGIIAAVMLSSRVVSPMASLANLLTRSNQTMSSLRQLDALMDQEDEYQDKGHLISRRQLKGQIECAGVSFAFNEEEEPVIYPSSLKINEGESIAIIGKNGSGKTSLLKMFAGLYQPTQGSLRFDGIDSKQIHPADLRRNVGYMPQDITLFHGTIRDNILFGTRQVTEHQLIRAVQLSGVSHFTSLDSQGLDKQVGEGGQSLSRGQRQAVALARSILNEPSILLMDEPTASMDAFAEKQFIRAMQQVSKDRTLILVTHKMSLLDIVDRVIVLDKGRVFLDGPRTTVLQKLSQNSASESQSRRTANNE
ncbi:ABC transporter [Grimontia sp. AD028]|uniref:ABC transporter, transmembrane region:ABC transporter:Peptidase C39, bacteriocin processing n=1 Tax=Grimontia indica TaxID=1056512 RepID=R1IJ68_9GAMM|nr:MULTISPECIES: type I secretion system permease/ATPase [Grimontia]EOD77482.1 ABC transporter, transmembrane region:ABC transporter:Peptidase C39, bacteriocin processing [Grimontia indica]KKD58787.1 ABC transporter [Grimontia sp. AD028]